MNGTMKPLVDLIVEDPRWDDFGLEARAELAASAVMADLGLAPDGYEISVLACDDARIAALNADFRGKPAPTNVLSWPSDERAAVADGGTPAPPQGTAAMPEELGDIAIAWDTCAREAAEQGKTMDDHVMHLLIHGMLHLLGYDHIRPKDAELMEGCEVRMLARLGIDDPYA